MIIAKIVMPIIYQRTDRHTFADMKSVNIVTIQNSMKNTKIIAYSFKNSMVFFLMEETLANHQPS